MTTPATPLQPWDDGRLAAAFATRASSITPPTDLVAATVGRVRTSGRPEPAWHRWLPAAAVVLLALGVVAGSLTLSDGVVGRELFRPGPTADLKTLDTGGFAFDYPAAWLGYDASAAGSGFSSVAVLGTQPVERRCGSERHVDLNCVYEQRLDAGHIRLFVSTGAYRGGTVADRPDIENGTTTRTWVGGMPAIFDDYEPQPDSYYREDERVHWEIALPGSDGTNVVRLEALLKEPGVAVARRHLDAVVSSFRFTNGPDPSTHPTPEPTPTETPLRIADLPVMTVEELIAAAESPSPEEVIVRGWLTRTSATADCNLELDPHPLIPHCEDFGLTLTDERLSTDRGFVGPDVPHVVPMLGVDAHAAVSTLPGIAIEVQAIGHLLDHRWTTCPADAQAECKARFIVDRVLPAGQPIDDELPSPWASPSDHPVDGAGNAVGFLGSELGGITVVSIGVADAGPLRSIEPSVEDINNGEGAWVIRALVGGDTEPVARTFLIGHVGWWTINEVTESGVFDLVGKPASDPPSDVLGLRVISVEEAIAIRDAAGDDREIAVRGWLPPQRAARCRAPEPSFFLEPYCQDAFSVLTSDRQVLNSSPPEGAFLQVEMDDIVWPTGPRDASSPIRATEVVVVGHFDDRRSGWCAAALIQACRDRFVVDRVEWADGSTQPLNMVANPATDTPTFSPVEAAVTAALPDTPILSVALWPGVEVHRVEPALREGRAGITDEDAVWIVRVLQDGRAVDHLVPDGTERIYRVENDGQAVLVGGAPPDAPGRSWPPEGVRDVPMPVGNTGLTPKAGVEDRTGLLVEARAAGEGDPGWPAGDLAAREMSVVQAAPDAVVVYWNGTLCDDRFVLTVYGEGPSVPPDRLQLRGERADQCRLALAHYGMRLQFHGPVDASTVQGFDRVGTPFEAFPPVNATVVNLPNDGGFLLPKVRAALLDLSGRITAVRLPRPDEPQPDAGLANRGVLVPDPSVPGRYQLAWIGGPCAPDFVIRINATLEHVVVTNTRPPDPPDCDTIAQLYRLILDIDGPLDPPAVDVRHADMSTGAS